MIHFLKYNVIGLLNTGITLVLVWVLVQLLNMPIVPANFLGYVAGGLNSYLLNRFWNFKSKAKRGPEIVRFLVVFGISYLLNLGVLLGVEWLLIHWLPLQSFTTLVARWAKPSYCAHVVANVVYVIASFSLYKTWVFRK